ncbi:MAG: hypothetical protein ACRD2O_07160, partial [Terriglobia bacterium]
VQEERFTEFDQFFHALVAAGKQSFTGFITLNNRAGPAAEPAVVTTGVLVSIWIGHSPFEALA